MRISDETAIKALALQSIAAALWIDGQQAQALRSQAQARALLGLAASNEGQVLPVIAQQVDQEVAYGAGFAAGYEAGCDACANLGWRTPARRTA